MQIDCRNFGKRSYNMLSSFPIYKKATIQENTATNTKLENSPDITENTQFQGRPEPGKKKHSEYVLLQISPIRESAMKRLSELVQNITALPPVQAIESLQFPPLGEIPVDQKIEADVRDGKDEIWYQ